MVLNSIEVLKPKKSDHKTFSYFDQENIFSGEAGRIVPQVQVQMNGLSLSQVGLLIEAWGGAVETFHARLSNVTHFREMIVKVFESNETFMTVNFERGGIGQIPSAHHSPIGAYDVVGDRVLIMDVARYKYPPVWCPVEVLWNGMNTVWNPLTGETRGFLIAHANNKVSVYDAPDNSTVFIYGVVILLGLLLIGAVIGGVVVGCIFKRKMDLLLKERNDTARLVDNDSSI